MDFSYTEEQSALRALAARLFGERFSDEFRKVFARQGEAYDRPLWAALAQAGILGTAIEARNGGAGLALTELALVLGALPLQRFGNAAQQALLPQVAAGDVVLSAALEEEGATDPLEPTTFARRIAGGWRLSGVKTFVPYALQAQFLLVSARTETQGASLFLLPQTAPGLTVEPQRSTSGEPQGRVTLHDVLLGTQDVVGAGSETDAVRWTIERARVALAALQLGVTGEALRRAAAYVSEREQFGRPIGTFQAVQHRLADCYIDIEALRSTYLRAVWALDQGLSASA